MANASVLLNIWVNEYKDIFGAAIQNDHSLFLGRFLHDIQPFDWVTIARLRPNENQLSDVIAAMFDQRWRHPFAAGIFLRLLRELSARDSKVACVYSKIVGSIADDPLQIFASRECFGPSSRADIDIHTLGVCEVMMRIEHKARGGAETYIMGKAQTDRLWADALRRANKFHISDDNVLESVRKHHVGLHSFRSMRRMEARRRNASALRLRHSQSLANRRQRPSQAKVRSPIQRFGRTTKALA